MIPSLDAHLVNDLHFRPDTRRLPITELGCSGAVSALDLARDLLLARPEARALVVSVELPSLTFQGSDASTANLVSCAIFGDGAAAALVENGRQSGFQMLDSERMLVPDSYEALGFDLRETGLSIVLGRQVASLIRCGLRPAVDRLLARSSVGIETLSFVALHPGGRKLIEAAEEALGLTRGLTQPAWDLLRKHGNLSSASVLFLLDRWMESGNLAPGDRGLMVGFGPGFSIELLLLECV
jgi:alkylresorcinol/alkylpyrone synthase